MRGIHDSGMPGGGTTAEKRDRMEQIIGLQREMLAKHVNPDPSRVPQIFVPYKEVLELYQSGMKLPDDVTIVWPDDNFGYIRQLPDARERQRSGGHGVYYHISYWGRPHDYLWLESTAPALVWQEMTRAYESGARQLWVVNVGDIKPIEAGMTLCDPAAGTGGFLLAAYEWIVRNSELLDPEQREHLRFGALKVGHLQMHMPNACLRWQRGGSHKILLQVHSA